MMSYVKKVNIFDFSQHITAQTSVVANVNIVYYKVFVQNKSCKK